MCRILEPGWNWVWPIIEGPRNFVWSKTHIDEFGHVKDVQMTLQKVDLRESVFNFKHQVVYTRDTVQVRANAVMYYSVVNVRQAIYEVEDLTSAVQNVSQTQLKEVFGTLSLVEALSSQTMINVHMQRNFSSTFQQWGLQVHRIELIDLTPDERSQTATYMKQQMKAERQRRAEFLEAEGLKSARRLRSEGVKMTKTILGVAEQESKRKVSEGQATATVEKSRAEKAALQAVATAMEEEGTDYVDFVLSQWYNDTLRSVVSKSFKRTVYMPYEASSISGLVGKLHHVFGRNRVPEPLPPVDEGHEEHDRDLD